jgi:hypothetical protein
LGVVPGQKKIFFSLEKIDFDFFSWDLSKNQKP